MRTILAVLALAVISCATPLAAQSIGQPTIDQMQWHRRVLVVSAPFANDPMLIREQHELATWSSAAAARDVTTVAVIGGTVTGAADFAASVRSRCGLSPAHFGVALIGKDGHVALRSDTPVTGLQLAEKIDAMPMRRNGQR